MRWIALKFMTDIQFGTDINSSQMRYSNDFGDPLTLMTSLLASDVLLVLISKY